MGKDVLIRDIAIAEGNARYDEHAKRILSDKRILAYIFKDTLKEVRNYSVDEIIPMIEGAPQISSVALDPGESNLSPRITRADNNYADIPGKEENAFRCKRKGDAVNHRIAGGNTEDMIPHEGGVFYDILTYLMVPGAHKALKILINLEAQRTPNPGYDLVTRSVYYGARRISAQKGTEFFGSDYNSLKKSYSIWICFNSGRDERGTITEYAIKKNDLLGRMPDKERYDLMSSVFIRLGGRPEDYEDESLQDMLMTIFSGRYTAQEIESRLRNSYSFKFDKGLQEEVSEMRNLSFGVEERGIQKGIAQGRTELAGELNQGIEMLGLTEEQKNKLKALIESKAGGRQKV